MMPALFRPRNYAFEVAEPVPEEAKKKTQDDDDHDDDDNYYTDTDDDDDRRKPVPKDIFDRLLDLVTPSERVQHDVKTRRRRQRQRSNKKKTNTTKKARSYME